MRYFNILVLISTTACNVPIGFVEPFCRGEECQPQVDAGVKTSDPRLYEDMGEPRLPGPIPQPSICPVPGQPCSLPSPFEETCINDQSYWLCVGTGALAHWEDRWCGAYPAALCDGTSCIGPRLCQ